KYISRVLTRPIADTRPLPDTRARNSDSSSSE
ncbi:hypothetical protein NPIL_439921, partial [Nephila pilipes]